MSESANGTASYNEAFQTRRRISIWIAWLAAIFKVTHTHVRTGITEQNIPNRDYRNRIAQHIPVSMIMKIYSLSLALFTMLITRSVCDPVLNEVKPGPWDNDGPFEGDIIQNGIGDCSFLSAMAVILRKDASALTNTIGKATSSGWPISL